MSNESYLLPGGRLATKNSEDYYKAWRTFVEPIEKALNIRMTAFDPDCLFITPSKYTFELPCMVVEAFNKIYEAADNLQEAVSSIDGLEDLVKKVNDALEGVNYQADICPNCAIQMGKKYGGTAVPLPCKKCGKMCCSRCVLRAKTKQEYFCFECYEKINKEETDE